MNGLYILCLWSKWDVQVVQMRIQEWMDNEFGAGAILWK